MQGQFGPIKPNTNQADCSNQGLTDVGFLGPMPEPILVNKKIPTSDILADTLDNLNGIIKYMFQRYIKEAEYPTNFVPNINALNSRAATFLLKCESRFFLPES